MEYRQLNDEPIEIEYMEIEGEEDWVPCFVWADVTYRLDEFIRTHNNPWCSGNFPEYIHGYSAYDYFNPLFIELIGDEAVNVYKEVA